MALELALAARDAEPAEVEQLDLLGLEPVPNRAPGRPPGARNRRTERMVEFLLARYPDPREVLLQMAATPVGELAATLRCTQLEAFQEKRQAAIAVLPYVAARQPVAIDLTTRGLVHLTIEDGQGAAGAEAELFGTIVENQGDGS